MNRLSDTRSSCIVYHSILHTRKKGSLQNILKQSNILLAIPTAKNVICTQECYWS
jgi:hypothetical protein